MQQLLTAAFETTSHELSRVMDHVSEASTGLHLQIQAAAEQALAPPSQLSRSTTGERASWCEQGGRDVEHEAIGRTEEVELQRQRALYQRNVQRHWRTASCHSFGRPVSAQSQHSLHTCHDQERGAKQQPEYLNHRVEAQRQQHNDVRATASSRLDRWGTPLQQDFLRPTFVRRTSGLFDGQPAAALAPTA